MKRNQFNHTLPKFILRGFCLPNSDNISVYKIKDGLLDNGFNINSGKSDKYFGKNGFYSDKLLDEYLIDINTFFCDKSLNIETNLSKVENKIALIFQKIKENPSIIISSEETNAIMEYAFIQFARTPKFKKISLEVYNKLSFPDMRTQLKNTILETNSSILDKLGITKKALDELITKGNYLENGQNMIEAEFNNHINNTERHEIDLSNKEYLKHFGDIVKVNKLKILTNPTDKMVVLPDTGIICLVHKTNNEEKIELLIPISNKVYILLYGEETNYECNLSAKEIDEINEFAYLDSGIVIFGNNPEQLKTFGNNCDLKEIKEIGLDKKFI